MPSLTFYPQHQRHLTLAAAGHCLEHYRLLREQAEGRLAPSVPGASLLIGIGMDAGVGALWAQGAQWEPEPAMAVAERMLRAEYPELATVAQVWPEVELGIRQYADQWAGGVRAWEVLSVHPYLDARRHPDLVLQLPDGNTYLTMPDMECRIGGVLTIVDQKTGAYPYKAEDWLWEPQLLVNCLALAVRFGEPVQYLIDYMQRPKKAWAGKGKPWVAADGAGWTFPLVHPVLFTAARRRLAESWLRLQSAKILLKHDLERLAEDLRDPAQCHGRYGMCEFYGCCFGEGGTLGEDDS